MTQDGFLWTAFALLLIGGPLWIVGELNRYGRHVPWWSSLGCILTSIGTGLLIGFAIGVAFDRWMPL